MSSAEAAARERGDPYENRRDGRDGVGFGQPSAGGQQSASGKLFKGLAHVVPDFGLGGGRAQHDGQQQHQQQPQQHQQQQQQQQQQSAGGGASSFMQKLNDLTHHHNNSANNNAGPAGHQQQQQADHGVDNILSKGKELIFMKFGLGK